MPFAAVFAGCFIIVGALSRWRVKLPSKDETPGAGPELVNPELRSRLDQEIRGQR